MCQVVFRSTHFTGRICSWSAVEHGANLRTFDVLLILQLIVLCTIARSSIPNWCWILRLVTWTGFEFRILDGRARMTEGLQNQSSRLHGTIIRPYALDRQLLRGNIIFNQRPERGRCVTLLNELYHLEAGAVVHEIDDVAVPAETRVLHRPDYVDKESMSFHARPFVRLLWHGMSLRLS